MIPLLLILYFFSKKFIICYFVLNYLISVIIYFKAGKNYYPHMKFTDEELKAFNEKNKGKNKKQYFHEDYPSFNRVETSSISFGKIYYGVLNYFWIKALLGNLAIFFIWLRLKVYFSGRSIKGEFTKKDRETLVNVGRTLVKMLYIVLGIWVKETNLEEEERVLKVYRKYLGEDYNPANYKNKYTTVIANHVSWADVIYMLSKNSSSFISKDSVSKIPFIGYCTYAFKTIYINRTSPDSKKETLMEIQERQKSIAAGTSDFPLNIYPEGTTSNGRTIMAFKKGAFYSLTPVKIFLLKVDNELGAFPLAAGGMNILLNVCLSLTFFKNNFEAVELPVFAPNDYLWESYKHLGKDKAEIFSEACRHVMSEVSGFPLSESSFETKLAYMSEIKRKVIKNT